MVSCVWALSTVILGGIIQGAGRGFGRRGVSTGFRGGYGLCLQGELVAGRTESGARIVLGAKLAGGCWISGKG